MESPPLRNRWRKALFICKTEKREKNIALAKNAPELFLSGKTPRLIDEWQIIPFIWDDIRFEIDKRDDFGQFILTGSATPLLNEEEKRDSIAVS